jgi:hypothetical protein
MTVYFAEEIDRGKIKIGYTSSPDAQSGRIANSLTMTSTELVVRAELPDADEDVERGLHDAFAGQRVLRSNGSPTEFFSPSAELWSLIGYVARERGLPAKPCECGSLIWAPLGFDKATQQKVSPRVPVQIPGVVYKRAGVPEKSSANVLSILRNHPMWQGVLSSHRSPHDFSDVVLSSRHNGVFREDEPIDLAKVSLWFSNEYSWEVRRKWLQEAVAILSREKTWFSSESWSYICFKTAARSETGCVPVANLDPDGAGRRASRINPSWLTRVASLPVGRRLPPGKTLFRLTKDMELEESVSFTKPCDTDGFPSGTAKRVAAFNGWDVCEIQRQAWFSQVKNHVHRFMLDCLVKTYEPKLPANGVFYSHERRIFEEYSHWCTKNNVCPLPWSALNLGGGSFKLKSSARVAA